MRKKVVILIGIAFLLVGVHLTGTVSALFFTQNITDHQVCRKHVPSCPLILTLLFQRISKLRCLPRLFTQLSSNQVNGFAFDPQDITLEDDAFQGADSLHFSEWWYFDAILNKEYSMQLIIQVVGMVNQHFVRAKINLYKAGEVYAAEEHIYWPDEFYASSSIPLIILDDTQIMKGSVEEGQWVYDVALSLDDIAVDLQFVGSTPGWKGDVPVGYWAVPLPKAEVHGTISVDQLTLQVHGIGYHDHNWEITAFAGVNFGWIWGKTHAGQYTMTYSTILPTWFMPQPLLVINTDNGGYITVDSDKVDFTVSDITLKNGMFIPMSYGFHVNDDAVDIDVAMMVTDVHHVRIPGLASYWRYHVQCTGDITIDGETERIDEVQIAEFIRFR